MPLVFQIDGVSGFSENPFVAISEANDVADFFMLGQLQINLADALMGQLRLLIAQIQGHDNPAKAEKVCARAFGTKVPLAAFWDCFFDGVVHIYSTMPVKSALHDVFIEFGTFTLESVEFDDKLTANLMREPRFAAEVFCKINAHRGQRPVLLSKTCMGCGREMGEDDYYFTKVDWDSDILQCSHCFDFLKH